MPAVAWCSFDVIKDALGGPRSAFPHDMTVVAGTQAPLAKANYVALMRFSNLGQARPRAPACSATAHWPSTAH